MKYKKPLNLEDSIILMERQIKDLYSNINKVITNAEKNRIRTNIYKLSKKVFKLKKVLAKRPNQ